MRLLAFETSTEACSVALSVDGQVIERFELAPRRHAELALPWAQALLDQAGVAKSQLDAIAVGRGPGAFTGVRLAIALGQGLALALDRPLLPVSTLQALALRAPAEATRVVTAIDARMGEVYSACYRRQGEVLEALDAETVGAPEAVALADGEGGWQAVGTGFAAVDGALAARLQDQLIAVDASALPHAADVATLALQAWARGERPSPESVEPAYLRNNVALTLEEQQALRAAKAAKTGG
ncbi:tRNA (adenosine(37)-N6)-threonylcarbamoyltransferase complex dimerization subunit type 1 TsaB [Pseudoxanthomonas winnipegensis]|uniref:tRNA threonylcarbamoyladenosine biosynthesis protein TsaB n=1 Tax=Pseudoxanthomonas winnipegensis TaxID=2480810 RepID=A0A4Q8LVC6_9GAMM|nr:tRNA (adenosine(37)-N6)-threonylcarbamoyltransferase complex dimerization subunit type 1 TsaB [Pseudoxanthomonas winnipegensis]RZZ90862.1 tRNA (adenosine(37)-N6)-threonylcarbamoyltransferase complex dimerization subunit type 1 TsaB [Pseudoxanthomonas winnipegensis]TAA36027.1 tRNA (adenosine(37)-N6)-threonylcarbamoyltransferase complex dimerization subunit type 1 TsaB [Pseudoxanthomonas winnipegensis]